MTYLCPSKTVETIKNTTEMKKIILSVLAIGLTMGAMAQKNVDKNAVKGILKNGVKSESIVYPETFNDCASTDEPMLYFSNSEQLWTGVSGTNSFGDEAYGQMYNGTSYQIKGIAAILANVPASTNVDEMAAVLYSAAGYTVGNELARVGFTTDDITPSSEGLVFDLYQFNFSSPVTSSDFLCAIEVAPFTTVTEEDGEYISGNISFVGTTEQDCATGGASYSYSYLDDAGTQGWGTISELWQGLDLDMMIFPIVEGDVAGLTDAELASLTYVYPNPAKNEVMLASSFGLQRVEIVNVLGQVVYGAEVSGNSVKVATSDFATGNYIVKMYTEGGVVAKKLVVE